MAKATGAFALIDSTVSLSDAGAHLSLLCDAGYGLDLLGKWCRDLKIMSLETT